ncbi:uncharacterized protein K02A2.6-like isoform X2 [Amphibalanus amphitrite]|uniref:uncharacterized protein K02A2.6-like isoform X2 n=1 Tax=Amphibalanus amphitrite TaxID=1232801 RepID=UPI001C913764|nr:uncharacterized protein K02A2.6-like isoform X2 [Amphibalanus amphitrite]XP_043202507.1 uncharacterized protein K02A2.6-like isoform X2 [Amphibalanus amphitrite]XP_043202508.1 uncharacterized protein K02A2.6-like isoform X2 [Amphibalanus amphitrite]XP_043202509.1 uncharacterized protein K02A2.6-like isoform X2 [Amphibalanus amphitrite]
MKDTLGFGLPDTIVSDNGPAFIGEEFQRFTRRNGIRHVRTAPHRPASNGLAERYVKEVKYALQRSTSGTMSVKLAKWLISCHSTPNATTGVTPASMMFGRELKTRLQLLKPDLERTVEQQKDRQKEYYDMRTKGRQFQVSDRVYARGFGSGPVWSPGVVVSLLGATMAEVRLDDGRLWRRHFDQLRSAGDSAPKNRTETDVCDFGRLRERRDLAGGEPDESWLEDDQQEDPVVISDRRPAADAGQPEQSSESPGVQSSPAARLPSGACVCAGDQTSSARACTGDQSQTLSEGTATGVTRDSLVSRGLSGSLERAEGVPSVTLRRSQRERRKPDYYRPGAG